MDPPLDLDGRMADVVTASCMGHGHIMVTSRLMDGWRMVLAIR